ncbi:MAG: hypothetical protein ACRKGH_08080 [Dehalogenimonas sp.]
MWISDDGGGGGYIGPPAPSQTGPDWGDLPAPPAGTVLNLPIVSEDESSVIYQAGGGLLVAGAISQPEIAAAAGIFVTGWFLWEVAKSGSLSDAWDSVSSEIGSWFSKGGKSDKDGVNAVNSQVNQIQQHINKLQNNPNSPDGNHWWTEIAAATGNIANELSKMGPKARQEALTTLSKLPEQTRIVLRNLGIDIP